MAKIQPISPRHVERPISEEGMELIMAIRKANIYGAVPMEKLLKQAKKRMSHNRIHKILLHLDLAKKEPRKSKRGKEVDFASKPFDSLASNLDLQVNLTIFLEDFQILIAL